MGNLRERVSKDDAVVLQASHVKINPAVVAEQMGKWPDAAGTPERKLQHLCERDTANPHVRGSEVPITSEGPSQETGRCLESAM